MTIQSTLLALSEVYEKICTNKMTSQGFIICVTSLLWQFMDFYIVVQLRWFWNRKKSTQYQFMQVYYEKKFDKIPLSAKYI